MNGKQWRIATYVGMLEHGEDTVTGHQVCDIARTLFPGVKFPPFPEEAAWELGQTKKLVAFVRDGGNVAPTLMDQLSWLVSNPPDGPARQKREFRDLKTRLGLPARSDHRNSIKESEWDERKKSLAPKFSPALRATRRVQAV